MNDLWINPIPVGLSRYGVQMVAIPVICRECGCQYQHDFPANVVDVLGVDTLYSDAYMTPVCPVCWRIQRRATFYFNQPVSTPFGQGRVAVNAEKISVDVGESTFVLPAEQVVPMPPSDPVKEALTAKIEWLQGQMDIQRQALADAQADVLALKEERDALRESLQQARAEIGKRVLVAEAVNELFVPETYFFDGSIVSEKAATETAERLTAMRRQGWKVAYEKINVADGMNDYFARLEREVERDPMPDPQEERTVVPVPVVPTKRVVGGLIVPVTSPDTAIQNRLDTIRADEETQLAQTYMNTFNAFMAATPRPTWKPLGGEQS